MARKLRHETPGGLYHVINRGNYRRNVFAAEGAAHSFVGTLEEAVARHGWQLQAYVLMRNHFHLVLETPEPNLTQGMHWLLCTVANRFNRFRNERGHLFQGRFQALAIEDYRVMARVVDYVHLNPVRAGLVPPEEVAQFPWSSLNRFVSRTSFAGLQAAGSLAGRGWQDNQAGWDGYVEYLVDLAANLEVQKLMGFDGFSTGWAIGSNDWRRSLAKDLASETLVTGLAAAEAAALREARWRSTLEQLLAARRRTQVEAVEARKGADWKLRLALDLRGECGASISWLARELRLGSESAVRARLCELRKALM